MGYTRVVIGKMVLYKTLLSSYYINKLIRPSNANNNKYGRGHSLFLQCPWEPIYNKRKGCTLNIVHDNIHLARTEAQVITILCKNTTQHDRRF